MVRTENRIRNGVEEHKHVGYIWWHPVSRVHDITYVPEILGGIGYFWSNVCEEVDQMKKTMIYYETCVITSYTTINRLFWMGYIIKLVGWGFVPNYFHGGK